MRNNKCFYDIIATIVLLIFIISSIYIKGNYIYIQIAINVLMIIFINIKLLKSESIRIIDSKLDIFLIILLLSTVLPIAFNTYASLSSSIEYILKYINLYFIYLLIRDICANDKKYVIWITNVFICITILFIIVGIDNLMSNTILSTFSNYKYINGENRLISLIGNPNTLGVFISIAFFMCCSNFLRCKDYKKKVIYDICIYIFLLGNILTYSKATYLIFCVILIMYIFLLNKKEEKISIIISILISLIFSIIYIIIFNKLVSQEMYLAVWLISIASLILYSIIKLIILKQEKLFSKIDVKIFIICLIAFAISIIIYVAVSLNIYDEFIVFDESIGGKYDAKKISNIKPNNSYILKFDIEAKFEFKTEDMFVINVIERDIRNNEIKNTQICFNEFKGFKNVEIYTDENTTELKIEFISTTQKPNKILIIKKFYINGELYPLEYKYLPTKLVEKMRDINIKYKTFQERIVFIKDSIQLSKENLIIGIGGNGWLYRYGEVQSYNYPINDTHSYITQLLVENGLIGLLAYIGLIIYLIILMIINKKNFDIMYIGIFSSIIMLVLHSSIDSDMYFNYIMSCMFIMLGSFCSYFVKKNESNNKTNIMKNVVIILISIICIILLINSNLYNKFTIIRQKKSIEDYNYIIKYEKYSNLMNYYELRLDLYSKCNSSEYLQKIEETYNFILNYKNKWKKSPIRVIGKSLYCTEIIHILKENVIEEDNIWIEKFCNIIIQEYEKNKEDLINILKEEYENIDSNMYMSILNNNYIFAISLLEK